MNTQVIETKDLKIIGSEMHQLMEELFPICRSITGDGVRESLGILKKHINLDIQEIPSGKQVFDWLVPKEWNIKDAYVKDSQGNKVLDFKKSNLHILNYSVPVHEKMCLQELKKKLHSLPNQPDVIPYLTSYYKEDWGFCLTHNELLELQDDEYEVLIDATLKDGFLSYGEYYKEGQTKEEILLSCYTCHPSLCNDNLSGVVLLTFLAKYLSRIKTKYSYRFIFIPETIGAITWLSLNEAKLSKVKHGLVATCVGDEGGFTYKKSRSGDAEIDRAVVNVLKDLGVFYRVISFFPSGSDERQFCSPGFNLPVGSLMRSRYGKFPQYHTSADNLDFVKPQCLAESFQMYLSVFNYLETQIKYLNQNPKCEPQLGKRGLYRMIGGQKDGGEMEMAIFWVLNLSDGEHSLLDIADRSGIEYPVIQKSAELLVDHDLLRQI